MTQHSHIAASHQLDYERTLILAVEVSGRSWVVAAQVPGLRQKGVKQQLAPRADALMAAVEGYKRRAAAAGMAVERVIVAYESGGSGFWLARPCCTDQERERNALYPVLGSCDADGLRASQLQHAVEHVDGDVHLGGPTLLGVRAQPVPDHAFVA